MLTKLQITHSAKGHATVQNSQGDIVNMLPGGLEVDNVLFFRFCRGYTYLMKWY